jgi:hypothetical protein
MLVLLISLAVILKSVDERIVASYKVVLISEAFMLLSFGFSWIVKGEALLKDKK